ncbi:unnamed protein product [Caenorhabditis bovis]|uniref:Uncharacterized protein n=1 Tax=Caenorhabditis bovis TaxID=2654633 RepID=A0A8S1ESF7_9PELO|nr:unnamed protein product [Caenorhabditis bovis]
MLIDECRTRNSTDDAQSTATSSSPPPPSRGHRRESETTIANKESANRTVRFSSSHLTSNDVFMRIDSWPNERRPASDGGVLCCGCVDAIRGWSRRQRCLLAFVVLLLLFSIASAIVLLIFFIVNTGGHNHAYPNNLLTTSTTMTSTTSSRSSQFLVGYVVRTSSQFHSFGVNLTTFAPDVAGLVYTSRIIGYSVRDSRMIVFNETSNTFAAYNLSMADASCATCQILSYDPRIIPPTVDSVIACCWDCRDMASSESQKCSVKGHYFEIINKSVEMRVDDDRSTLHVTTMSNSTTPCTIQTIVLNGTSMVTQIGDTIQCPSIDIEALSTIVEYKVMNVLDAGGNLRLYDSTFNETIAIDYHANTTAPMVFRSQATRESIELIAMIYDGVFYATRRNRVSSCVSTLIDGSSAFLFDGAFRGGDWIGDRLMVWYAERDGVNLASFEFEWPDDTKC